MIRVFTSVVCDLFHYGHEEFFKQAHEWGDYLIVGVCSDEATEAHKRRPCDPMEKRIANVRSCPYVDEVIPDAPWFFDPEWIEVHSIDLVVHGDDYSQEQQEYYYGEAVRRGIFRTVPYTQGISTSEIIRRCRAPG